MYNVVIERSAVKLLERIPNPHYNKLRTALLGLAKNPRPHGYLKLRGRDAYRIRVGDYRIIYEIKDDQLIVSVITIAHRKDVYE